MRGRNMIKQGSTLEMPTNQTISRKASTYPPLLRDRLGKSAPDKLELTWQRGNSSPTDDRLGLLRQMPRQRCDSHF